MSCIDYEGASEKALEDWAAAHMAKLIHPNARLLGRQVTLPSGQRLDLLFDHHVAQNYYLTVVEMKAGEADVPALLQCLGYVEELRRTGWGAGSYTVRGVVAAPSISQEVHRLTRQMRGMACMDLFVSLQVEAQALYEDCSMGFPVPPPDVDLTRPQIYGYTPWHDRNATKLRNVIGELWRARTDDAEWRETVAVVPLRLSPHAVAYPNGNGKR